MWGFVATKSTLRVGGAVATILVGLLAACGQSVTAKVGQGPQIIELGRDHGVGIADVDPARGKVISAGDLRLTLEFLFDWHHVTLVQMMRHAHANDAALNSWIKELSTNTDDITGAIGLVYGPTGARAFGQLWAQHTQFLLDYADAVRRHDTAAEAVARSHLHNYTADSGTLFDRATAGGAPASSVTKFLEVHVAHMTDSIDALAAGDATKADGLAVTDHEYLYTVAKTLAGAISTQQPGAFPGATDGADTEFCSILNQHTGLLAAATIGGFVDPDPALRQIETARINALATTIDTEAIRPGDDAEPGVWRRYVAAVDGVRAGQGVAGFDAPLANALRDSGLTEAAAGKLSAATTKAIGGVAESALAGQGDLQGWRGRSLHDAVHDASTSMTTHSRGVSL